MLNKKYNRDGEIRYNNYGTKMQIINYYNCSNVKIKFLDNYGYETITEYNQFCKGQVKNPYDKSVYNTGYIGIGKYKVSNNSIVSKQYIYWNSMLMRCYDNRLQDIEISYKGCTVCDEWLNFQNFSKWVDENYYEVQNNRMELDKDILNKCNKLYSPITCVFVPKNINCLFTKSNKARGNCPIGVVYRERDKAYEVLCSNGFKKQIYLGRFYDKLLAFNAYKVYKEKIIKNIADKYKNEIPKILYDALYKYHVEIDD